MSSDTATREVFVPDWRNAKPWDYEPWFSKWMLELTAQGLHAKADIARVLAMLSRESCLKDATIAQLQDMVRGEQAATAGATQRAERLEAGLRGADQAPNDWINTYADDMCDPKDVAEARARIMEYGTVGYIAKRVAEIRAALKGMKWP